MNENSLAYKIFAEKYPKYFRISEICIEKSANFSDKITLFDLYDIDIEKENKPIFGMFAGVHGIEAIGVKILHEFLRHILEQVSWNESIRELLKSVKIKGIPIVNPSGFRLGTRANRNGVDLMRNAPIESAVQIPFVGGQRISNMFPWFRGSGLWEAENQILLNLLRTDFMHTKFSLCLDIHSGFGTNDFLWTPYAKQKGFPPTWDQYTLLKNLLDSTLPNHIYRFQPQSENYCTSGDFWDFIYEEFLQNSRSVENSRSERIFMPLTLEVGSWVWLKKSPLSAMRIRNYFNPVHPHREKRVLRRHLALLMFLVNFCANSSKLYDVKKSK